MKTAMENWAKINVDTSKRISLKLTAIDCMMRDHDAKTMIVKGKPRGCPILTVECLLCGKQFF